MRAVLFALLAAVGLGQAGQDARPLLTQVGNASRNLTTYRAEGRIAQDLDIGLRIKEELHFRVAVRSPQVLRIEMSGGPEWSEGLPYTATCEGRAGWIYFDKLKAYKKVGVGDDDRTYCMSGTLTGFEHVADDLTSAVITGVGQARFEGRSQSCAEVEAHYRVIRDVMIPPGLVEKIGRVTRRMCIDRARLLILRDRIEADWDAGPQGNRLIETVTYDRIERNPQLSAALFEFQPPKGSKPLEVAPLALHPLPAGAAESKPLHTVAPPTAVETTEPEYTPEAWDEGIQGTVFLAADVAADGAAGAIAVSQSIGYGLDEKAIECVRKWRFNPATEDGRPVKGTAGVVVRFSLPDERPTRPSPRPVARPTPTPRSTLPEIVLKPPSDLDSFFYVVAINFKARAACERINESVDGGGSSSAERGHQIRSMRSSCYRELAALLHDANLCDKVVPVRTDMLDGSRFDKSECLSGLNGSSTVAVPYFMEPFVRLMRKLGYNDRQVAESRYGENPANSSAQEAYDRLLSDNVFLGRLYGAPTYAEARSRARIRPANPTEFLYQMVGVDYGDSTLCSRISPNATLVDFGRQTALLRSRCFLHIALNTIDAPLCDQLPRAGAFPHVNKQYDSAEKCREVVAIYSRPNFDRGGLHDGPYPFPRSADFETALRQIGYSQRSAGSRIAKPTPDDYWLFLSTMAREGSEEDRREFLRRVMALR